MACKNVCKLCNHLVLSTAIAFTGGNLVVTIPEGSYNNGEKYCIVLAQSIPNTTTITAPVMIQIGTGTTLYPLENRCCAQVTACGVRTRTKYATRVATSATGGAFKMLGNPACSPNNNLTAINGTAPTAEKCCTGCEEGRYRECIRQQWKWENGLWKKPKHMDLIISVLKTGTI